MSQILRGRKSFLLRFVWLMNALTHQPNSRPSSWALVADCWPESWQCVLHHCRCHLSYLHFGHFWLHLMAASREQGRIQINWGVVRGGCQWRELRQNKQTKEVVTWLNLFQKTMGHHSPRVSLLVNQIRASTHSWSATLNAVFLLFSTQSL